MIWTRAVTGGAAVAAALTLAGGCESQSRVVYQQPGFLDGVPTAQRGGGGAGGTDLEPVSRPGEAADSAGPVVTNPDGSVRLISTSVRHVMVHTANFLNGQHEREFFEQVLSAKAREHFRQQGRDERETLDELRRQRGAILAMFVRMPAAEQSATVVMEKRDRNVFVLRLTGTAARDQELTELWVTFEKGSWRLLWVAGDEQ